jgi:hypothetical protein
LGLQYKILYKKGPDNKVADALSRQTEPLQLAAISTSTPKWLEIILEGYNQDDQTKQLLTELSLTSSNGRIQLGTHIEAHKAVLLALHSSGLGGHSGITATYHKVRALFAWPNMKQYVKDYINACELCAQAKPEHCRLPGLLQPLPVPTHAWHTISLDFIEGYLNLRPLTPSW